MEHQMDIKFIMGRFGAKRFKFMGLSVLRIV